MIDKHDWRYIGIRLNQNDHAIYKKKRILNKKTKKLSKTFEKIMISI